jgi:hypothetical protein
MEHVGIARRHDQRDDARRYRRCETHGLRGAFPTDEDAVLNADAFFIQGRDGPFDIFIGGNGADKVVVEGTGGVILAGFNAAASNIEAWQGNGKAVLGTSGNDVFDFGRFTAAAPTFSIHTRCAAVSATLTGARAPPLSPLGRACAMW